MNGSGTPQAECAAVSEQVRACRLGRLQQELRSADCAAAVLYDPINIRYASDARNMQVWTMHVPSRYLFVPATGLPTLFEYRDAEHLAAGLSTIGGDPSCGRGQPHRRRAKGCRPGAGVGSAARRAVACLWRGSIGDRSHQRAGDAGTR